MDAKVWGCVAEIHPKELIVSLPHGLRGRVSGPEVCQTQTCSWLRNALKNVPFPCISSCQHDAVRSCPGSEAYAAQPVWQMADSGGVVSEPSAGDTIAAP